MTTASAGEACITRGILRSAEGDRIVLAVPHTDYELHLALPGAGALLRDRVGKRVTGVIEGEALRIHPSPGGGRFIEPAIGEPRIVAGVVREIDAAQRCLVIDAAVPMRLRALDGQDFSVLKVGALANCHVRSGLTFAPSD